MFFEIPDFLRGAGFFFIISFFGYQYFWCGIPKELQINLLWTKGVFLSTKIDGIIPGYFILIMIYIK